MGFRYSVHFLPLTITALLCSLVALPTWRRRHMPAGRPLFWALAAVVIWTTANVLELGSSILAVKLFWVRVEYLGIVVVPGAWLVLALQYAGLQRWLARRYLALLAAIPLATVVVAWTLDRHGLFYRNVGLDTSGPFYVVTKTYGPWFWGWVGYSYILLLTGSVLLVRAVLRQHGLYRSQVMAMLIAALVPWLGNLLYITRLSPLRVDLTPITFGLSALVLAWALLRYHLLELMPVARDAVFESMGDAVLVLDAADRIADLNPAAQRMAGRRAAEAIGQPIDRLLANWPRLVERYSQVLDGQCEVELGEGDNRRIYDLRISPLSGRGRRPRGRLVVLRDISESKRAQEEIRRRAEELAALYEITRDLGAGQDLPDLMQAVVRQAANLLGASGAGMYLYDPDCQELEVAVGHGVAVSPGIRLRLGEGMAGRVAQTRQPLIVNDYSTWSGRAAVYDDIPFRAVVEVPMLYGGKLVGVLVVHEVGDSTRTFNEADVRLLTLFAGKAASAVYNGRLLAETRQHLREVTLLSRIIALTAAAEDLASAFQEVCQELTQFLHTRRALFALLNPGQTGAQVIAEYRSPDRASALGILIPVVGVPAMTHLMEQRTPLVIADAQSDPRLARIRRVLTEQEINSVLLLPVVVRDAVLGVLALGSREPREFHPAEVALLEHVTRQVGQTLERLQLYQRAQQRSQRMATLAEISASLNTLASQERIGALIGRGTLALSGAERAAVFFTEPDRPVACLWFHGLSADYASKVARKIAELPGQQVVSGSTEPVLVPDIAAEVDRPTLQALAASEGFRAFGIWPLVYEGRPVAATVCYYDQPHMWSEEEHEVMESFARQAAVALENARLYDRLQAMNQELQEALRAREEMIQNVSHELRTPLALIRGYAELMAEGGMGSLTSELEEALGIIGHQAKRLHILVNRLLLLQTIEKRTPDLAPIDIGLLLDSVVQSWQPRARQVGIQLTWNFPPDLPVIMGDSPLLTEVLDNLIDNAIKFSPDDGCIHLDAWQQGPELIISAADQGIGLPPGKLDRLFERFYQVEGGLSRRFGGMGVGLALCAAIVAQHHGRIWAESPGLDEGSTFYVALPIVNDTESR